MVYKAIYKSFALIVRFLLCSYTLYDVLCLCLISVQLIIYTPVRASDNDSEVELCCEMQGYIRPDRDLQWLNINLSDNRFTVEYRNGQPNAAQFGGDNLMHSRISVVKISNPTVTDSGWYVCALLGTDEPPQGVYLIVTGSPSEL